MSEHLPHPHARFPDVFDDAGDGPLDPQRDPRLEAMLRALATELCRPPDELTQRRHLAAMREARRELRRGRWLRHTGRAGAVATLAILAMAVSGLLPAQVQQTVADAATVVGITLPSPDPQAPASDQDRDSDDTGEDLTDERAPAPETQDETGTTPPASPAPRSSPPAGGDTTRSPAPEESEDPDEGDLEKHLPKKELPSPPPLPEGPGVEAPPTDAPGVEASSRSRGTPPPGSDTRSSKAESAPQQGTGRDRREAAPPPGTTRSQSRAEAGQERRPGHPGHPGPH